MVSAALNGMDIKLCGMHVLWSEQAMVDRGHKMAETSGARITLTEKPAKGMEGSGRMHSDSRVSTREPDLKSAWSA